MTTVNLERDRAEQQAWYDALPRKSRWVENKRQSDDDLVVTIWDLVLSQHPETLNPNEWGGTECMLEWAVTQWPALYAPEVCQRALLNLAYWRRYAPPKEQ